MKPECFWRWTSSNDPISSNFRISQKKQNRKPRERTNVGLGSTLRLPNQTQNGLHYMFRWCCWNKSCTSIKSGIKYIHQRDPTLNQVSGRQLGLGSLVIQPMRLVGQSTSTRGLLGSWSLSIWRGWLVLCQKTSVGFKSNVTSLEGRISGWWHIIFLTEILQQNLTWEERKSSKGWLRRKREEKKRYAFQSRKKKPSWIRWFNHPGDPLDFNGPGWKQVHTTKSKRHIIRFFYVINTFD